MTIAPPNAPGSPSRVSAGWTGAVLALGAVLAGVGTLLPYETLSGNGATYTVTGLGAETATGGLDPAILTPGNAGLFIFGGALVVLIAGLLVAVGRGRLWVGLVGAVAGAIGLLLGIAAVAAPSRDAARIGAVGSVGVGAVLSTVGMALALVAASLAVITWRRTART